MTFLNLMIPSLQASIGGANSAKLAASVSNASGIVPSLASDIPPVRLLQVLSN
jgi:hypothetical protein